ncbi:MAG: radical SAM protein [Syntrophales bacterium]
MNNLLLIHPPVSKPCEPPAGIARLAGALREHGVSCTVIDANVEGLHFLLNSQRVRDGSEIRGNDPIASENGIVSPDFSISSEIGVISPDLTEVLKARGRDRAGNTWTKRAVRSLPQHLQSLRSWSLYGHPDRYRRAVADINRVLAGASSPLSVTVSLADYEDAALSPLNSADLIQAAAQPERNPFYPYFRTRLMSLLKGQNPEIIGISVNYLSQALCAFAMIGFIRSLLTHTKIILGGGLVTSWLRQPQWKNICGGDLTTGETDPRADVLSRFGGNNPFTGLVDNLVVGPGEDYLLRLVSKDGRQTSVRGDSKYLSGSDSGLSKRDITISEVSSDLAASSGSSICDVPCPDYRSFPWELYLSPESILPYSASTGCYWRRCRFCPETAEGNPYRPLPIKKVLADLDRLRNETNPVLIHFLDNAVSPALLTALAEQRNRVPWYGFVRITEQLANPTLCHRLHEAGCVMLKLGLESGDQGVLDALEKGIDLKTASRVLRNLKEAGIGTYVYLLFGTPAEDRAAARRTMEYIVENSSSIDFLNVAIFNMPVSAAAADDLVTRPFSTGDLSLYTDFEHPRGWNRREVRRFVADEVRKHPAIAAILNRVPRIFTSNHAPLQLLEGGRLFDI